MAKIVDSDQWDYVCLLLYVLSVSDVLRSDKLLALEVLIGVTVFWKTCTVRQSGGERLTGNV